MVRRSQRTVRNPAPASEEAEDQHAITPKKRKWRKRLASTFALGAIEPIEPNRTRVFPRGFKPNPVCVLKSRTGFGWVQPANPCSSPHRSVTAWFARSVPGWGWARARGALPPLQNRPRNRRPACETTRPCCYLVTRTCATAVVISSRAEVRHCGSSAADDKEADCAERERCR